MKENYWLIGELESDMNFIQQQEQAACKDKHREEDLHWHKTQARVNNSFLPNDNNNTTTTTTKTADTGTTLNSGNIDQAPNNRDGIDGNIRRIEHQKRKQFKASNEQVNNDCNEKIQVKAQEKKQYQQQQQQQQQQLKKDNRELNLSFCGCGFLGIYHVGVASCFHEYAPQLSMQKISGSSAGALVAVAHICGNLQLAYATTDILRVAIDARARALGPFHPSFDINATVREALERGLPDDVHLRASGKLHVSLTRVYDGENVIISQFDSKEDVIQVLLCSSFIPFWSGLVAPKFKGITYVDGGFSNNLLILDDKTVTVSPFAGEADICPQDDTLNLLQISLSNTSFSLTPNNLYRLSHALLPPPPEVLSDLCEQGFADGIRFLQRMNLISCTKCLEIRSSLLVSTNGEDMEEAFTNQAHASDSLKSTSSFSENHHIRLEQQEQKMIEISGDQRRNSVVSTTSQIYSQQQMHIYNNSDLDPDAEFDFEGEEDEEEEQEQEEEEEEEGEEEDEIEVMNSVSSSSVKKSVNGGEKRKISFAACDECVLMRKKALRDPLPKQFSDRIRDACDTVNKSLSNWIYSHRPIKYLSYLAAPYYLPIDISLALLYRCWRRLPFIRSELIDCVYNIIEFLVGILKRISAKSSTSTLLMGPSSSWEEEEEAIEYEKELIRHHQQKKKITNQCAATTLTGSATGNSASELTSTTTTTTTTTTNTTTVESSFHSVKITTSDRVSLSKFRNSRSSSTTQLHSLEDTFDSIVDVTSNQEARIFAYYFRDAKNRLQVTEIFDLQKAAELSSTTPSEQSHTQSQQVDKT